MGTIVALVLVLSLAFVVLIVVGTVLAPFALVAWIVEGVVGAARPRPVTIARAAGKLGRWIEIVNTSYKPIFYGEVVRSNAEAASAQIPIVMALRGVLVPAGVSRPLAKALAEKYPASRVARGHFLALAVTDPGADLIVTNLTDDAKIRELTQRLPSMDAGAAPRLAFNSVEIALIEDLPLFEQLWREAGIDAVQPALVPAAPSAAAAP
jgi:hypothetical protein